MSNASVMMRATLLLLLVSNVTFGLKVLQVPFNRTALHRLYTRRSPCHGRVAKQHTLVANQRTIDYFPGFLVTSTSYEKICTPYISLHFTRRTSHPFIRKHTYEQTTGMDCAKTKKTVEYWPWGKSREMFKRHLRIMTKGAIALRESSCSATSTKSTKTPEVKPSTSSTEIDASSSPSASVTGDGMNFSPSVLESEVEESAIPIPSVSATPCAKYYTELHPVQRGQVTGLYELDEPPHHEEPLPPAPKNPVIDFNGGGGSGSGSGGPMYDTADAADYYADAPEQGSNKDMFKKSFEDDEKEMYKDLFSGVPIGNNVEEEKDDYKSIEHIVGYLLSVGFDYYFESDVDSKEILAAI